MHRAPWAVDCFLALGHPSVFSSVLKAVIKFNACKDRTGSQYQLRRVCHNPLLCLCTLFPSQSLGSRSLLLWGDDHGGVNLLWLLRPRAGVFEKPFGDGSGPQRIFMPVRKEKALLLR